MQLNNSALAGLHANEVKQNTQRGSTTAACRLLCGGVLAIAGQLLANEANAADSVRVQWATNGHYYQLFEGVPITWSNAKTACESKSAHLATITSEGEQGFIESQLLAGRYYQNFYFLGGISNDTYTWTWATGESFVGYTHWHPSYPVHNTGQNYLSISVSYNPIDSDGLGGWHNEYASMNATGYICEWSTQNYIDTTLVPDLNGNGVDEVAQLLVDFKTGKHTVFIKDPATDKLLTSLVYATSFTPPSGLVVIADTNNNGAPEIGVLFTQFGFPNVQIRDVKTKAVVRNINFMNPAFKPKSIGVGQDNNGNGADEIVVLGINKTTGAAKAEIRDSKTGLSTNNTPF